MSCAALRNQTDLGSGPDLERRVEEVCYYICLLVIAHPYLGICWTTLSPTASTMVLAEPRYSTNFEVLISSSRLSQSCAWIGKLICQTRRATQLYMQSNGTELSWTKVSITKDVIRSPLTLKLTSSANIPNHLPNPSALSRPRGDGVLPERQFKIA